MQEVKRSNALTSTKQRRWSPPILAYAVTTLYILTLFIGTHLPNSNVAVKSTINLVRGDKLAHFLGYLGLAVLIFGPCKLGRSIPSALLIGAGLAICGALDELTQPWAGRSAEFSDWLYDLSGIVVGWIFVAVALCLFSVRFRQESTQKDKENNLSAKNPNETTNPESVTPSKENAQV